MPRKANFLNVRKHLEHVEQVIEGLRKYGMVPVVMNDMAQCDLINRAILRKHAEQQARGDRKDLYIPRTNRKN